MNLDQILDVAGLTGENITVIGVLAVLAFIFEPVVIIWLVRQNLWWKRNSMHLTERAEAMADRDERIVAQLLEEKIQERRQRRQT